MTSESEVETDAVARIRDAGERVAALGLVSRTGLAFALVLSMGADFLLLPSGAWVGTITAAQALLFILAVLSALRSDRKDDTSTRRSMARVVVYFVGLSTLALIALTQKWWIVLQGEGGARAAYAGSYRVMGAAISFAGVVLALGRSRRVTRFFIAFAEQPARQTAFSFLALTMFGAFLLTLPSSVRDPSGVSFVDALFMATSAVCVTGLAVQSVAGFYTPWGQAVLITLVQIGGLGIMVLSSSLVVLTGRKLRARSSAVLAEVLDADSVASLRGSIVRIVSFTLGIEALGALLLYLVFQAHPEVAHGIDSQHPKAGSASLWWAAIFHSISAFCNAGFSLMNAGFEPFADSYAVCSVIMLLIVLGGLGFPVLSELSSWVSMRFQRRRPHRLSLHTRTVLIMSGALIAVVALLLLSVEWNGSFGHRPFYDRGFVALFQSVTLRTAGFNTVNIAAFSNAGFMIAMLFMFIGASPGGTGGGVKVTTFAVLFATLRAELRNEVEPHLFDRRLPPNTIRRAISVVFVAVIVLTFSVFSLLVSERGEAIQLAFEAVSAFGTVGLSAGVTPGLTSFGKLVIIVTMLIGRVGPLTVALATSERGERAHHLRPHERVLIG